MYITFFACVYAVLGDCQNVVNLARGLGMNTVYPAEFASLEIDCCETQFVTCTNTLVSSIGWYGAMSPFKALNGTINGTAIPSTLTILYLGYNKISGTLPLSFPKNMVQLYLLKNYIEGPIPSALPSKLQQLRLSSNYLNGSLPSLIPPDLKVLEVEDNRLLGDVPSLPSTLYSLFLGSPGIFGNQFSGSVVLESPISLFINNNLITDVVVQDPSHLAQGKCDLSNNPLLNNSNIVGLSRCVKSDLYYPDALPNTRYSIDPTTSKTFTTSFKKRAITTTATKKLILNFISSAVEVGTSMMHVETSRIDNLQSQFSNFTALEWILLIVRWLIDIIFLYYIVKNPKFKTSHPKAVDKNTNLLLSTLK
eukprot:NODE_522_length_7276_cov_0.315173.p3 type:complete len:365 gc:universal NODE_522_length_7276_cov_0.315173:2181-3275(+)